MRRPPAACWIAATIASSSSSFVRQATAPASSSAPRSRWLADAVRQTTATSGRAPRAPRRSPARRRARAAGSPSARRRAASSRRRAAASLPSATERDDLDVGAQPEQQLERLAEDVVVLDEDDADRRRHARRLLRGEEQRVVRLAARLHVELELRVLARRAARAGASSGGASAPVRSVSSPRGSASRRSTTAPRDVVEVGAARDRLALEQPEPVARCGPRGRSARRRARRP